MGEILRGTQGTLLEQAYNIFFTMVLIILAVMVILCLIRTIMKGRIADRLVAVNMTGTIVMVMISVLAVKMEEGYIMDICIVYALISFLAVVVLTKVYLGVYEEKRLEETNGERNQGSIAEKNQKEGEA